MRNRCKLLLCILASLLLRSSHLGGQDYTWWNNKHNWDGFTHWTKYLIISPGFLGPNAMPVPNLRGGIIDSTHRFMLASEMHRSPGDKTENIYSSLHIPIAKGIAAIKLEMVIWEQYRMDTLTRDARRARDEDGKGQSIGDLLVSTVFQIIRNKKTLPDVNLGIHLRTATGSNKSGARFSDAPGYSFDLSMSKRFYLNTIKNIHIEPYGVLGFYAWQVNRDDNMQDDALVYGAGVKVGQVTWFSGMELAGYHGYFNNGDRPMVVRMIAGWKVTPSTWLSFRLQHGLHDYSYTSIRMGIDIDVGPPIKKIVKSIGKS